jgi:hypothetical protein
MPTVVRCAQETTGVQLQLLHNCCASLLQERACNNVLLLQQQQHIVADLL